MRNQSQNPANAKPGEKGEDFKGHMKGLKGGSVVALRGGKKEVVGGGGVGMVHR